MKRSLLACFLAFTLALGMTACGGAASGTKAADSAASANAVSAPTEPVSESFDYAEDSLYSAEGETGVLEDQKIIYTGDITLETTAFDDTVTAMTGLVESLGGYLQSSTVGNGGRGYRWADYTIRVPSEHFQRFLEQAGTLAHVTWQNTDLQNITETYYDTEGRLKTQQIKLERLQKLLAQAENMEDIITIESAISETEWSIENLSDTLRHYDALVDFATVNVRLNEVYKLSNTEELPESFGDRMSSAFRRGLSAFGNAMEDFAVALAYNWIWVLLWAAVGVGAVLLLRGLKRRRACRKATKIAAKSEKKQDDTPAKS